MIESIVISYSVNVSLDASITRIISRGIRRVVQIILKRRLNSRFVLERTAGLGTRRNFGVEVRYMRFMGSLVMGRKNNYSIYEI